MILKSKIILTFFINIIWFSNINIYAQGEWRTWTCATAPMLCNKYVTDIAFDSYDNKWFATSKGLVKFDGTNWTLYDSLNAGLKRNYINRICIDKNNNSWIFIPESNILGSPGAIQKFNGDSAIATWDWSNSSMDIDSLDNIWYSGVASNGLPCTGLVYYNSPNSGGVFRSDNSSIPNDCNRYINTNGKHDVWFNSGTIWTRFDGTTFFTYPTEAIGLGARLYDVCSDHSGNTWFGTDQGLIKWDGSNFTKFNTTNSNLPYNEITKIAVDESNNLWLSTKGLVKFVADTVNYIFNSSNSLINSQFTGCVSIDRYNNIWFRTPTKLLVYNENGVVLGDSKEKTVPNFSVSINPNPANDFVKVVLKVNKHEDAKLFIYDLLGNVKFINNYIPIQASFELTIDVSGFKNGVYFLSAQSDNYMISKKIIITN